MSKSSFVFKYLVTTGRFGAVIGATFGLFKGIHNTINICRDTNNIPKIIVEATVNIVVLPIYSGLLGYTYMICAPITVPITLIAFYKHY